MQAREAGSNEAAAAAAAGEPKKGKHTKKEKKVEEKQRQIKATKTACQVRGNFATAIWVPEAQNAGRGVSHQRAVELARSRDAGYTDCRRGGKSCERQRFVASIA